MTSSRVCPVRPCRATCRHRPVVVDVATRHPHRRAAGVDRSRAHRDDRRRPGRTHAGADGAAQRASPEAAVDPGRRRRGRHPEAAQRLVLPGAARAASSGRPGVVGGDHDRLHHRHLDPEGRRPRQGAGLRQRDLEVDGVADLRRDRRRRRRAAHPPARSSAVRLRLARRHLRPCPRAPPRHLESGRDRHRPACRRPSRSARASMSATRRTRRSGASSSPASSTAAWPASSW